ncbi:hypothetical protein HanRHA438_Chr16g0787461 [Helianthus annuus]|nr:hypothetical protein HanRHA438_Chr16g0787461 [Helianthus annuus]
MKNQRMKTFSLDFGLFLGLGLYFWVYLYTKSLLMRALPYFWADIRKTAKSSATTAIRVSK